MLYILLDIYMILCRSSVTCSSEKLNFRVLWATTYHEPTLCAKYVLYSRVLDLIIPYQFNATSGSTYGMYVINLVKCRNPLVYFCRVWEPSHGQLPLKTGSCALASSYWIPVSRHGCCELWVVELERAIFARFETACSIEENYKLACAILRFQHEGVYIRHS